MRLNTDIKELENIIKNNLLLVSNLKNQLERTELEKYDLLKEIALGIIDAIDSFERAEEGIIEKTQEATEDAVKIMKRYQLIQTKLFNLLQKYEIKPIEFPDNRLIVGLCEVVETKVDPTKEDDAIVSVLRNGYLRNNELIRAAQVICVKN